MAVLEQESLEFRQRLLLLLKEEVSKSGRLEYAQYNDWIQKRSIKRTFLHFHESLTIINTLIESNLERGDLGKAIIKIQEGKYGCEKIIAEIPTTLKKRKEIKFNLEQDIIELSYLTEMVIYLASRNKPIHRSRLKSYLDETRECSYRIIPNLESMI